MLSRIFWIGLAGIALVAGIALQDGRHFFSWDDGERSHVTVKTDRNVEERVQRAVDRSFERMTVVDAQGKEVDVPVEAKRALAEAVGRLVKAETELAVLRVSDVSEGEIQAARTGRDQAREEVERMKQQIRSLEQAARVEQDAVREQLRREIQEDVRATVREAVRS